MPGARLPRHGHAHDRGGAGGDGADTDQRVAALVCPELAATPAAQPTTKTPARPAGVRGADRKGGIEPVRVGQVAAQSIRHITGKPIKFIGVGEKTNALEPFYPDRIASRILGMGDVLGLIEEIEQKVDREKAEKLVKKIQKGKGFNLEDFREQLQEMQRMGGVSSMLDKLPGINAVPAEMKDKVNDKMLARQIAVINSMTMQERRFPDLIKGNRKKRIAMGCGQELHDVNRMLKQFLMMQKMMKKFKSGNMANMIRGIKNNVRGMR